MAAPWEKYKAQGGEAEGPWAKYGGAPAAPQVAAPEVPSGVAGFMDRYGKGLSRVSAPFAQAGRQLLGMSADDPRKMGEMTTEALSGAGVKPETAAGFGVAANMATQAVPMLMGGGAGGAVGRLAAPAIRSKAEDLVASSLKPTLKALKSGDAAVAIDTMLDQGINLTKGGITKLRDKITVLNDKISEAIAKNPGNVKLSEVYAPLLAKLEEFKMQVNPKADMKSINAAWKEFKAHPLLAGKSEIPVPLAQELKQGTYQQLSKKYGEMGSADIEAQKAMARGLKEGVAKNAPEVAEFNKEESRLIRTLDVAERRVLMDANKNPMGLSLLAKNPAAWAAFMADRSGPFKVMLARIMNAGKVVVPQTMGQAAGAVAVPGAEMASQQRIGPPQVQQQ